MKVKATLAVVGVFLLALGGCAGPAVPGADAVTWQNVEFSARATSVMAKEDDPVSLLEAQAAAAIMAKANLLALVKGEFITGGTTVADLMFEGQEAEAQVKGFLARATVTYEEPIGVPVPGTVTAVARLTISRRELKKLEKYVD